MKCWNSDEINVFSPNGSQQITLTSLRAVRLCKLGISWSVGLFPVLGLCLTKVSEIHIFMDKAVKIKKLPKLQLKKAASSTDTLTRASLR